MSGKTSPFAATQGLPPEKVEIIHELNEAFAGNRELISNYLRKFGWSKVVAPNVRIIKREAAEKNTLFERVKDGETPGAKPTAAPATAGSKKDARAHVDRSPYYRSEVSCAFCDMHFTASILRSKSLILEFAYKDPQFPLIVPTAKGVVKGFLLEDPLLRNVIVCPKCLYSSSIIGNFVHEEGAGAKTMKSRVPDRKIAALKEAMIAGEEARRKILPSGDGGDGGLSGETRTKEQAIVAFRLVVESARVMADFDPLALFQAGEAFLSAARLAADMERTEDETACWREALPLFEKFYQVGSVSATPLYLIAVLNFLIADYPTARTWISRMVAMRHKLEGATKYLRYAENLKDAIKEKIGTD